MSCIRRRSMRRSQRWHVLVRCARNTRLPVGKFLLLFPTINGPRGPCIPPCPQTTTT